MNLHDFAVCLEFVNIKMQNFLLNSICEQSAKVRERTIVREDFLVILFFVKIRI